MKFVIRQNIWQIVICQKYFKLYKNFFFQLTPYKKTFSDHSVSTGSPVDCILSTPRVPGSNPGGSIYTKSVWWIYNSCEAVIRHVKPCLSGSGYTQIWMNYCRPNHHSLAPPRRGALSTALGPNSAPTATIGCSIRSAPPRRRAQPQDPDERPLQRLVDEMGRWWPTSGPGPFAMAGIPTETTPPLVPHWVLLEKSVWSLVRPRNPHAIRRRMMQKEVERRDWFGWCHRRGRNTYCRLVWLEES